MKYVLALDQGTTSSRAILFDRSGRIIASAQREFTQHYPQPGWVEHDPQEIWTSQAEVMHQVCLKGNVTPGEVAAIGITNQRETTLVWDRKTGQPVYPAIVWQDRRTAAACAQLQEEGWTSRVARKTGLVIDAYFSATKVQWILKHVPGARAKARAGRLALGTVDSWLIWNLTRGRVHVTDASNASRTMLFDIQRGGWDDELLQLFGIPDSMLPEVRASSEVYGETELGGVPVPIAGVAGDQQAALFGQACHRPGMIKCTYGTGSFLLMHTGSEAVRSKNRLVTTIAWRIGEQTEYALEGSIFIAGAVVQWLRDGLGVISRSADVEALAERVPDSGGVVFVPAFAGLGAPHWDPYARGTVVGLTRGSTSAHLARAALESIAFQVTDVVDAMRRDSGLPLRELRVDGGACGNNLLMQFQADLLRGPVVRPQVMETTALGAAYLAGLAVGFWKSRAELARQWQKERVFKPALPASAAQKRRDQWQRALRAVRAVHAEDERGATRRR